MNNTEKTYTVAVYRKMRKTIHTFTICEEGKKLFDRYEGKWAVSTEGYLYRPVYYYDEESKKTKNHSWFFHREVLGNPKDGVIDHINRNITDNRICNLRHVDKRINVLNTDKINSATGYRGVWQSNKHSKPYYAEVKSNGVKHTSEAIDNPHVAAYLYNLKAEEIYGDFAFQNNLPDNIDELVFEHYSKKSEKMVKKGLYERNYKGRKTWAVKTHKPKIYKVYTTIEEAERFLNTLEVNHQNITKYNYVHYDKEYDTYRVILRKNKKALQGGRFKNEHIAAYHANKLALEHLGNEAKINMLPKNIDSLLYEYNKDTQKRLDTSNISEYKVAGGVKYRLRLKKYKYNQTFDTMEEAIEAKKQIIADGKAPEKEVRKTMYISKYPTKTKIRYRLEIPKLKHNSYHDTFEEAYNKKLEILDKK